MTTFRRSEKRCLWKPQQFENSTEEDSTAYGDVFRAYSSKPKPKSFFRLCANSLIVVQELALSSYFLARHRMAVLPATPTSDLHLNYSNAAIISALFLAIFYGTRSDPSKQQNRRVKAKQRGFDFLLLAVLLRFLASVLRTLTASYSSDTVQSLAWAGMVLHVAACDYNYANGIGSDIILQQQQRPPFSGGTVALNAALFSTTLLNSRLSSNSGAYLFSSLAVVLFAFYSSTRHAISASYPPAASGELRTALHAIYITLVSFSDPCIHSRGLVDHYRSGYPCNCPSCA